MLKNSSYVQEYKTVPIVGPATDLLAISGKPNSFIVIDSLYLFNAGAANVTVTVKSNVTTIGEFMVTPSGAAIPDLHVKAGVGEDVTISSNATPGVVQRVHIAYHYEW